MPTVKDIVRQVLVPPAVSTLVSSTVLATLPVASSAVGTLDLGTLHLVINHISTGLKLFSGTMTPHLLTQLRRGLTDGKPPAPSEVVVKIDNDADVVSAQRACQKLTRPFFSTTDCVRLTTTVSELARNIYMYARTGEIRLKVFESLERVTFEVTAKDEGPGIPNSELVMSGTYVSRTGLGRGLVGSKAILDNLTIQTAPGKGTTVVGTKRARRAWA